MPTTKENIQIDINIRTNTHDTILSQTFLGSIVNCTLEELIKRLDSVRDKGIELAPASKKIVETSNEYYIIDVKANNDAACIPGGRFDIQTAFALHSLSNAYCMYNLIYKTILGTH